MKSSILKGLAIGVIAFTATIVSAHPDDDRVSIESDMTGPVQAGTTHYVFELVDTKLKVVLKDKDLTVTHEKILHMMAYDPALKEFQHVHPTFDGRYWNVDLAFPVNGEYWIWTQGQLVSDGAEFSSSTRLKVQGGKPAWPTPPVLTDFRKGSDGISTVELSGQKLVSGQMIMLTVTLGRTDGSTPKITPYLGAFAHMAAVPSDGDSLLHVHPMNGSVPNIGMLHVTFPEAGFYRIWTQFLDDGVLRTVPLAVQVF